MVGQDIYCCPSCPGNPENAAPECAWCGSPTLPREPSIELPPGNPYPQYPAQEIVGYTAVRSAEPPGPSIDFRASYLHGFEYSEPDLPEYPPGIRTALPEWWGPQLHEWAPRTEREAMRYLLAAHGTQAALNDAGILSRFQEQHPDRANGQIVITLSELARRDAPDEGEDDDVTESEWQAIAPVGDDPNAWLAIHDVEVKDENGNRRTYEEWARSAGVPVSTLADRVQRSRAGLATKVADPELRERLRRPRGGVRRSASSSSRAGRRHCWHSNDFDFRGCRFRSEGLRRMAPATREATPEEREAAWESSRLAWEMRNDPDAQRLALLAPALLAAFPDAALIGVEGRAAPPSAPPSSAVDAAPSRAPATPLHAAASSRPSPSRRRLRPSLAGPPGCACSVARNLRGRRRGTPAPFPSR